MLTSNSVIRAIEKRLGQRRLFYVCRDIERAADLQAKNYFIITNNTAYAKKLARQDPNIILIKRKNQSRRKVGIQTVTSGLIDTIDLLNHPRAKQTVRKNDFVLVFKNNSLIEKVCQKNCWRLLNPPAALADKIESKISQIAWLGKLTKYLAPHYINICQNIKWTGKPFILQFNRAHTGSGTLFINSKKKLNELAAKFPRREVRISRYIKGPVFTNNNVVWDKKVLMGNINFQITGLRPFTDNKFATIGNDWALPTRLLRNKQIKQYEQIVNNVGKKLATEGWKGLFGLDIIMEQKTNRLYLLEINARQPASTTFESRLQKSKVQSPKSKVSTFEAHVAALLGLPYQKQSLIKIYDGAQIIQRVTKKNIKIPKIKDRSLINTIKYNNTLPGSDLIRWQFSRGVMKKDSMLDKKII